jgi:hypothetical protein
MAVGSKHGGEGDVTRKAIRCNQEATCAVELTEKIMAAGKCVHVHWLLENNKAKPLGFRFNFKKETWCNWRFGIGGDELTDARGDDDRDSKTC